MSGVETLTTLTASDLRRIAEKADGLRGVPLALYVTGDGYADVEPLDDAQKGGRKILLELDTENKGPGLHGDAKIQLSFQGTIYNHAGLETADAVFTSQAAVEKFVLPYYMRYGSASEVEELQENLFKDPDVIASIHLPTSVSKGVYRAYKIAAMKVPSGSNKPTMELIGEGH